MTRPFLFLQQAWAAAALRLPPVPAKPTIAR